VQSRGLHRAWTSAEQSPVLSQDGWGHGHPREDGPSLCPVVRPLAAARRSSVYVVPLIILPMPPPLRTELTSCSTPLLWGARDAWPNSGTKRRAVRGRLDRG
jgi:hypothetical protein